MPHYDPSLRTLEAAASFQNYQHESDVREAVRVRLFTDGHALIVPPLRNDYPTLPKLSVELMVGGRVCLSEAIMYGCISRSIKTGNKPPCTIAVGIVLATE